MNVVIRAFDNATRRWHQALMLTLTVASGVALAIAIIAASNGVDAKVNSLLDLGGMPLPPQLKLDEVQGVLAQTRAVLTNLAYAFTAALVGAVTWVAIGRRRRDIGIARQHGTGVEEVLAELVFESISLCFIGGVLGVGLARLLCKAVQTSIPLLPMDPKPTDILAVFPVATSLSFVATAVVAAYFALRPSSRPTL